VWKKASYKKVDKKREERRKTKDIIKAAANR